MRQLDRTGESLIEYRRGINSDSRKGYQTNVINLVDEKSKEPKHPVLYIVGTRRMILIQSNLPHHEHLTCL